MKRRQFLSIVGGTISLVVSGKIIRVSAETPPRYNDQTVQLRFTIASDGHYGQPETEYVGRHTTLVDNLNRAHETLPIDFTFFNGDLIHDEEMYLPKVKSVYQGLKMPYYVSHGNHDKCTEQTWKSTWNYSFNYSFEHGDSAFVVLNTASPGGEYICPDIAWTRNELKKYSGKKNLFVFMHITPIRWTKNGINCPSLTKLFTKQKNLKAIFHGHDHDQDYVMLHGEKPYFFDGHIAGNWGTNYSGYRIIELLASGTIVTYQLAIGSEDHVNNFKFS
jgi:hypothetical protein